MSLKFWVCVDELYPFRNLWEPQAGYAEIELSEDEYQDYRNVMKRFFEWQEKLKCLDK